MKRPRPGALYGAAAIAVLGSVLYALSNQVLAAVSSLALAVVTSLMGVFVGTAGDGAGDGDTGGARSSPQGDYSYAKGKLVFLALGLSAAGLIVLFRWVAN